MDNSQTTSIPQELRQLPKWVTWRNEERDGKVPYRVNGARASTTDPSTWSSYDDAAGAEDGVGFVFSEDDSYCGGDLDGCVEDGVVHPAAAKLVSRLASYTEFSPSGTGLHVIMRASLNGGRNKTGKTPWGGAFEIYDRGRYFTVTGAVVPGAPQDIHERQSEVEAVRLEMFPPVSEPRTHSVPVNDVSDHELLKRARVAKNGAQFRALYDDGDTSAHNDDDSAADLALCNVLAFYCGPDHERIDRLFRGSGLIREKWDEKHGRATYGELTIEKALNGRTEFYGQAEPPHPKTTEQTGPAPELSVLLDSVEAFLRRYVVLTDPQYVAVTLWIAHAHALEATSTTPYLHVTSPQEECGKTRLLESIGPLSPKSMFAASLTPAVMYHAVQKFKPTFLVDEADNLMSDKDAKGALLGILNAGYRRGLPAYRMGGSNRDELKAFETFCAKAIAGLDNFVATLASRCLRIEMQRRGPSERIAGFYHETVEAEAKPIHEALVVWAEQAISELRAARPVKLGVRDRMEEALRLLVAIAEMASEQWGGRARKALIELAEGSSATAVSRRDYAAKVLEAARVAMDGRDHISTAALLAAINADDELPFGGWGDGKGLTAHKLAGFLREYGKKLKPHNVRIDEHIVKGYRREDFEEAWARYLPTPRRSATSATSATSQAQSPGGVADVADVADARGYPDSFPPESSDADLAHMEALKAEVESEEP